MRLPKYVTHLYSILRYNIISPIEIVRGRFQPNSSLAKSLESLLKTSSHTTGQTMYARATPKPDTEITSAIFYRWSRYLCACTTTGSELRRAPDIFRGLPTGSRSYCKPLCREIHGRERCEMCWEMGRDQYIQQPPSIEHHWVSDPKEPFDPRF